MRTRGPDDDDPATGLWVWLAARSLAYDSKRMLATPA
jgi:hypothetical protein